MEGEEFSEVTSRHGKVKLDVWGSTNPQALSFLVYTICKLLEG